MKEYIEKLYKEFIEENNNLSLDFNNYLEKKQYALKQYASFIMNTTKEKGIIAEIGTGIYDSVIPYMTDKYEMISVSPYAETFKKIGFDDIYCGTIENNKIIVNNKKLNMDNVHTIIIGKYSTPQEKEYVFNEYLNGKNIIVGSYIFNGELNKEDNIRNLELFKKSLMQFENHSVIKNYDDNKIRMSIYEMKKK